jgi:TP901 family phage tail tape measure protein
MPKGLNKSQIEVALNFTANTKEAKAAISDLQKSLQEVAKMPGRADALFNDKDLKQASNAALELQQHLQAAVNVDTGKLDLSRFSMSLKSANKDLTTYYNTLMKAGEQGQQAFLNLARTISSADAPVTRINKRLAEMGTVLKNTAKWQISSTLLHGFIGSIQSAYHYAQDLNESLNNIRIVTGQSTEQMAQFAKQANAAAKELSTTTTEYTQASLIFYQQGLDDAAVKERTDATIKMANVTKDSATDVSSYMTAIWNNFDDGSESLEHYADVITALGAATASSSAEIASGLEKFAGIANTVGLSYDYATSALATVVATTRQSEEVVGTAFKTIFARLQGLKLGETLEDGVDLNKYSQALNTVGVQVLDTTGEMRKMDDILDDLADKWEQLSSAQKTALAQTVAGTRQYNQLVSLMDNWDFMESNLAVARGSEGTLQEQADIYAESWEAARDRVTAAAQEIYQNLLDDEFFIKILNGFEKVLTVVNSIIEGFGGLKGIISTVGSLFLTYYAKQVPQALENLRQNFMVMTGQATKLMLEVQNETKNILGNYKTDPSFSQSMKIQFEGLEKINEMQQKLIISSKELTESERAAYEMRMKGVQALYSEAEAIAQEISELEKEYSLKKREITSNINIPALVQQSERADSKVNKIDNEYDEAFFGTATEEELEEIKNKLTKAKEEASQFREKINFLKNDFKEVGDTLKTGLEPYSDLLPSFVETFKKIDLKKNPEEAQLAISQLIDEYTELNQKIQNITIANSEALGEIDLWEKQAKEIQNADGNLEELKSDLVSYLEALREKQQTGNFEIIGDNNTALGLKTLISEAENLKAEDVPGYLNKIKLALQDSTTGFDEQLLTNMRLAITKLFGPDVLENLDLTGEKLAELKQQLPDILANVGKMGKEVPDHSQKTTQAFTQFASSIMSAYAVMNSFKRLGESLKKTLEGDGDALEVLGAVTASFMSVMTGLNAVQALSNSLIKAGIFAEGKMTLAKFLGIEATVAETGATEGLTGAVLGLETACWPLILVTIAIAGTIIGVVSAISGLTKAYQILHYYLNKDEEDLKNLQNRLEELSNIYDDAKNSVEEFKNSLSDYKDAVNELDKLDKSTDEYKETLLKANEAAKQLIETYKLFSQYEITEDGLIKIDDNAIDEALEEQQKQLANASQNYYSAEIRSAQIQDRIRRKDFEDTIKPPSDDLKSYDYRGSEGYAAITPDIDITDVVYKLVNSGNDVYSAFDALTDKEKEIFEQSGLELKTIQDEIDARKQLIEEIKYDKEQIALPEVQSRYSEELGQIEDEGRRAQVEEAYASLLGESIQTIDESKISQWDADVTQQLKDAGVFKDADAIHTVDDSRRAYVKYIKGITNEADIDAYLAEHKDEIDKIDHAYANKALSRYALERQALNNADISVGGQRRIQDVANSNFGSQYSADISGAILQGIANGGNIDFSTIASQLTANQLKELQGMSTEEWASAYGGNTELAKSIQEAFQNVEYDDTAYKEYLQGQVTIGKASTESLISGIQSGDITAENISENEEYQKLLGTINDINAADENLISSTEILNKTWLVGTQEYQEALERVQDELYKMDLQSSIDSAQESIDKFKEDFGKDFDIDADGFKDALEDILDQDYSINVKIHSEAEQEFDSISNGFDDIQEKAAMIGESYLVAADDVRELNNTFPGILEGMEYVADGSIQLNQDVVESAMAAAEADAQADAEATIEKLNHQATTLEAKQKTYKAMAQDAENLAKSESMSASAAAEVKNHLINQLGELETETSAETADAEMLNAQEIADSAKANSEITAKNWVGAYDTTSRASYEAAKIAIANMDAMSGKGSPVSGGVNFDYNGSSGQSGVATHVEATRKQIEDASSAADWESLAEQFMQMSESAGAQANDIRGMIAAIGAKGLNLDNALGKAGKGKGSGGKSTKQETKDLKDFFDEFDRFYPFQKAIDDLADTLSDLDKVQQHLSGNQLIKSLEKENKLFEKQKENVEALLKEQKKYQSELQESLGNYGMTFDLESGNIANYYDATKSMVEKYNAEVIAYNVSAQDDAAKARLDSATNEYEKFKTLLSKYQSLLKDVQDSENQLDDLYYKQVENNLKAFEVDVKLDLDIKDARRKANDFIKEVNTNFKEVYKTTKEWADLFEVAIKNSKTYVEDSGTLVTDLEALKEIKDIIDNPNYNYGSSNSLFADRTAAIEKYRELTETLMSDAKNLYELYQNAWSEYLKAIDEVKNQWGDIIKSFDEINSTLDHYTKVIELIYGGENNLIGRKYLEQLYEVSVNNSLSKQNTLRQEIKTLEQEYDEMIAAGAKEGDEDLKKVKEAIDNANNDLQSEIEKYIDTIQSQLENSIQMAKAIMDRGIWGTEVSEIQQQWNDAKEQAEGYYDEVERIYELESLESKWKSAINSTSSLKIQQQLKNLMDQQLASLEEKTYLSERDIELAEKELEVYKTQIALEDAQNNKNAMKLVRNEQGNWTYQYVADEGDVLAKQEDYLAKVDQWRTAAIGATEDIEESVITAYEKFSSRMTEIMNDVTLSEQEREEKIAYLNELYWGENGIITKAVEDSNYMQSVANRATYIELGSLYQEDVTNYEKMTTAEKQLIDDLRAAGIASYSALREFVIGQDGNSGMYGEVLEKAIEVNQNSSFAWESMAATAIGRMYTDPDSVTNMVDQAYADMTNALNLYTEEVKKSEEASGIAWTNVENQLAKVKEKIDDNVKSISNIIDKSKELSAYRNQVAEIENAWNGVKNSVINAANSLDTYVKKLKETTEQAESYAQRLSSANAYAFPDVSSSGSPGGGSGSDSGSPIKGGLSNISSNNGPGKTNATIQSLGGGTQGVTVTFGNRETVQFKTNNNEIIKYFRQIVDGKIAPTREEIRKKIATTKLWGDILRNSYVGQSFDTGGYTGSWGSDGKLALLHQKEIVLNQADTRNLLDTIHIIRDITSSALTDNIQTSIAKGIGSMVANMLGIKPNKAFGQGDSISKENVFYINAEFPNADSVAEIQEALLGLPNLANQFISANA